MWDETVRLELLQTIREKEASLAVKYLPPGGRLLEVGAGHGYQARFFQSAGFQVKAIDVQDSHHITSAVFPIQIYDGLSLPFSDETFDVVFSSNVLEHISRCENLLVEMGRVLKGDGVMVHIVPTPSWRIWTSITHYIWAWRLFLSLLGLSIDKRPRTYVVSSQKGFQKKSLLRSLRVGLFPFRHGVRGNWLTEVYQFSQFRWSRTFQNAQLQTHTRLNTGLFYTGYGIPGSSTSMVKRAKLARYLGSSSMLYVLKKIESK